nr:MAG TPA: hypothetical protein [Caudoviricetes sp.]
MKCTPEVLQKIYEQYPHLTVMEFITLMWLQQNKGE